MISAPQQTGINRVPSSNSVHLIGKAGAFGRLMDDPDNASGFDLAEIGDVVMVRQVDHERVDRHGLQFAAAFHAQWLGAVMIFMTHQLG
jgi:hypothetical protein